MREKPEVPASLYALYKHLSTNVEGCANITILRNIGAYSFGAFYPRANFKLNRGSRLRTCERRRRPRLEKVGFRLPVFSFLFQFFSPSQTAERTRFRRARKRSAVPEDALRTQSEVSTLSTLRILGQQIK
jgi:hypothetical protein